MSIEKLTSEFTPMVLASFRKQYFFIFIKTQTRDFKPKSAKVSLEVILLKFLFVRAEDRLVQIKLKIALVAYPCRRKKTRFSWHFVWKLETTKLRIRQHLESYSA